MVDLRTRVGPMDSPVVGGTTDFTHTRCWISNHRNRSLVNQLGNNWDASARRKMVVNPTNSHHVRLGVRRIIDSCCVSAPVPRRLTQSEETVKCVNLCQLYQTGQAEQQRDCKLGAVSTNWTSVRRDSKC